MELVGSRVPNRIMKRIDAQINCSREKPFLKERLFLDLYRHTPHNCLQMKTSNQLLRREYFNVSLLLLLITTTTSLAQSTQSTFDFYFSKAQQDTLALHTQQLLLKLAYQQIPIIMNDSVKYWNYSKIMVTAGMLNDTILFKNASRDALNQANSLGKPNKKGDVHWNYGAYYLKQKKYDSSYFHYDRAYKIFASINNNYYSGKMLYNMAYVSSMAHDYTGAEIHLFQAIQNFEEEQKHKQLYLSYNLLGTISDNLEEFEKAIDYYNQAFNYIPFIDNSHNERIEYYNNMGLIYHKLEHYDEAIKYFDKGLSASDPKKSRPSLYAKLLDNRSYSYFLKNSNSDIIEPMNIALALRDSIGDTPGSVMSRIHLAQYYAKKRDTIAAIKFAKQAFNLASENQLNRDILKTLALLASIDVKQSVGYLKEYLALTKKLHIRERSIRNKFTAIRYETDKYISENERLSRQRWWIIGAAITISLLFLLIYWNTRQRSKNKALIFEREQQQHNEDMFLLALENKNILERGRNLERLRISEELHDGILARLFSVRFKWAFLELHGTTNNLKQHNDSINHLVDIETDIRNISHDLRNELIWNELEFLDEIKNTFRERSEYGSFQYRFHYDNALQWEQLPYLSKTNISRIVDEILQNIIKHAQATYILAEFTLEEDLFTILVKDNGKGFKVNTTHKGIGLKNLKNRAEKLNGTVILSSDIGYGTSIQINFPQKL